MDEMDDNGWEWPYFDEKKMGNMNENDVGWKWIKMGANWGLWMKWIKMDDAGSALLKSERSQRAVQLQLQPMQKVLHLGVPDFWWLNILILRFKLHLCDPTNQWPSISLAVAFDTIPCHSLLPAWAVQCLLVLHDRAHNCLEMIDTNVASKWESNER